MSSWKDDAYLRSELRLGQQQQADEQCTDPNDIFQFDMKNASAS
jgi:hypothetical protein